MPIPDFQSIMLPLLRLAGDGKAWLVQDARDRLADEFRLTDDEREQLLPSGTQRTFANRVAWAVSYLKQAQLVASAGRSQFQITDRGRTALANPPGRITIRFLMEHYPEFREFKERSSRPKQPPSRRLTAATNTRLRRSGFSRPNGPCVKRSRLKCSSA
jgi:restriction system protein